MRSDLGDLRLEFLKEGNASLLAQRQTLLLGGPSLAGFLFHGIELAHKQQDRSGLTVLGVELESVVKFPAHMGEASRPYHCGSADLFVALVAIALQDAASCARSASLSMSNRASPGRLSRWMPGTGVSAIC